MKRIITLYFLLPVICCFISCAPPVGNFGVSGSGGASVDFWFIERIVDDYYINDFFYRDKDFYITSFQDGDEVRIQGDDPDVTVFIDFYPDSALVLSKEVTEQYFPFSEAGKHEVRVTYQGKTKSYRITVRGVDPLPPGSLDGLGGGIIWL